MFTPIVLRGLINSEYLQLLKLIVDKIDEGNAATLKLQKVRDELAAFLPLLKTALNNEIAFAETKVIQALDDRRDFAIVGLQTIVKGNTYHEDVPKKEAAELLQSFFKAQGSGISRLNYQAETAVLNKIIEGLKNNADYVQAISLLGLGVWVTNLEAANDQFETVYKSRNTEISKGVDTLSFGELKKQSIPVYYKLLDLIESRFKTALEDEVPTAPYQNLANEINALITSFNALIPKGTKSTDKPEEPK